jgi:mRNA interferase HigB
MLPSWGVRVFNRSTVTAYAMANARARPSLYAWFHEVEKACWTGPDEVKRQFPAASIIDNNRVIFNVGGNNYRIIVMVKYEFHAVYIRFIGTHAEYDKIDAATV